MSLSIIRAPLFKLSMRASSLLFVVSSLTARAADPIILETSAYRFTCDPQSGRYEVRDQQAGAVWRSNPHKPRFGMASIWVDGKLQQFDLAGCESEKIANGLDLTFRPVPQQPQGSLKVRLRSESAGKALGISYEAQGLSLESVRLLDEALSVTADEGGYVVVPVREGILVPADSGLAFTNRFDTYGYEGCHMAMLGVVKRDAAVLVTWADPYVVAEVRSRLGHGNEEAKQTLSTFLELRNSAKKAAIHFLGRGDYVTIGKAYREIARERGWLVPWSEKLKQHPERAQLFGAINYKLWSVLTRRMNEDSSKELSVHLSWTFDEAAQVAEHLKNDLKLDKVLFTLGGWIHRGYDCQHPDILPTAPECGGDAAFSDCARRVMRLGYVFCLHDNYQDIYRDSPSWNEACIMKRPDGSLVKGGHWNGGIAYLTCSRKALELANRPQNLAAVKKLSNANSYFIDTTYASGLQECFDTNHPLTRWDDMKWKQALSDEARRVFGIFGSECGREWGIPHSDFFEGLTGVSGAHYHNRDLLRNVGGTPIPLFEIVYRDCIAMYGKYGYDVSSAAEYVLHHLSIGRPLNYHEVPDHLYWTNLAAQNFSATEFTNGAANPALFTRADQGWAEQHHRLDRFVKNTYEILSPLNELTSQMRLSGHRFLTPDRKVQRTVFGEGPTSVEVVVNGAEKPFDWKSKVGGQITLPPCGFVVESDQFVAFHALSWNGLAYTNAPLFTLRAEDGRPLGKSKEIRVFHGFGEPQIKVGGRIETVARETLLAVARR